MMLKMTVDQGKDTITHIPVIDLTGMKTHLEDTADQVLAAAREVGFFFVRIPSEQKEYLQMFDTAKDFFAQPAEEKLKYSVNLETNFGYSALRQEGVDVTSSQRDFKESYNMGRLVNGIPQHELAPSFSEKMDIVRRFQDRCNSIAVDIMECMAIALKIPEEQGGRSYFSRQYLKDTAPSDVMRTLHYPALEASSTEENARDEVRIGRHSDYGLITLLWQNKVGGLQIQSNREPTDPTKMTWLDVPVRDDCLVVNLGDCLQYWTNGLLRSTKHRVIFKPGMEQQERYSIAYFVQGGDMALDPVPSTLIPAAPPSFTSMAQEEPVHFKTSNDYLRHRLSMTYTAY